MLFLLFLPSVCDSSRQHGKRHPSPGTVLSLGHVLSGKMWTWKELKTKHWRLYPLCLYTKNLFLAQMTLGDAPQFHLFNLKFSREAVLPSNYEQSLWSNTRRVQVLDYSSLMRTVTLSKSFNFVSAIKEILIIVPDSQGHCSYLRS